MSCQWVKTRCVCVYRAKFKGLFLHVETINLNNHIWRVFNEKNNVIGENLKMCSTLTQAKNESETFAINYKKQTL